MKKLLSLLSVLTISGTAAQTTIASSPYQKEETIKNSDINYQQANNLERFKRTNNNNFYLRVPRILQLNPFWCGPAIAESILRFFRIRDNDIFSNINSSWQYQSILALHMQTAPRHVWQGITRGGTQPENWTNVLNYYINTYSLNNGRQYSITPLIPGSSHFSEFNNLINNSLENNTPVALAYIGILPEQQEDSPDDQHFIVINGITRPEVPLNGLGSDRYYDEYTYMNPYTGTFGTISSDNLSLLIRGEGGYRRPSVSNTNRLNSYLISYIPNAVSSIVQTIRPNQTEPMELGRCGIERTMLNNFINSCFINKSRYIRSTNENYCSYHINYKNGGSDEIEDWYKFLSHNIIKIRLSYDNVNEIIKSFILNKKDDFINSLINDLFEKMPKKGNRPNQFSKDNELAIASMFWNHFPEFHEKSFNMKTDEYIIIDTNTIGEWGNIIIDREL